MSSDELIGLLTDVAGIKAELPYVRRDIATLTTTMTTHGEMLTSINTTLTKICERLPDCREDHGRDGDPPAAKWPVAWMAKIGAVIGAAIGTAIVTYQAGPAMLAAVAGP